MLCRGGGGNHGCFLACVGTPGALIQPNLPSVGQGSSDTNPYSHEDSGQTCGHRGGTV